MKVLHYVDENKLAWMTPWIQLLKELEKLGVENTVLCRKGGTLSAELKKWNICALDYTPPAQWLPPLAREVGRVLDRVRPDLIHTRLSAAAMLGGWWGHRKKIPVISTFDKYPKARYYRRSDVLIGCSSAVTEHIRSLHLPARKIETILNPVLAERYVRDESVRSSFRADMGVKKNEILVLGMGRFVDWKAWDDYLRAVAQIPIDSPFRFWLVGGENKKDFGMEWKLRHLAERLNISGRVKFFPFAADVRPWLWAADVFVQTSKEPEGFSLMLIEAMAAGLLPIATNIGGTPDIVHDGENGLFILPRAPYDLAEALLRTTDSAFRERLSQQAQKSASEVNVRKIAAQTFELYNRTLCEWRERS